jgi:hypothetical protein
MAPRNGRGIELHVGASVWAKFAINLNAFAER